MNVRFFLRIEVMQQHKYQYTDLVRTVELPYVPTIDMCFEGNRVKGIDGYFDKINEIRVFLETLRADEEAYSCLVPAYIAEGWIKHEKI